jgi:8-oxo-dGTP diphosphatase
MAAKIYRPLVAVDVVVFGAAVDESDDSTLRVLLIERKEPPFKGQKVLPGGLLRQDESLEEAARRVLRDKTGLHINPSYLEQLYTYGAPKRDPRERALAVAYMALVRKAPVSADPEKNPYKAEWCLMHHVLSPNPSYKFGFDHKTIIEGAYSRLAAKARYAPIGFDLMPEQFTLGQFHRLYEAILRREVDKRNFYKKILSLGVITPTGLDDESSKGRPARLYRFDKAAYESLIKKGIHFEI